MVDISINMMRKKLRKNVKVKAEIAAEERILDALVGETASEETRQSFRKKLREGLLDESEVEINLKDTSSNSMPSFDIPGMPGAQMGMINLGEVMGGVFGDKTKKRKMKIIDAYEALIAEESDKMLDQDDIVKEAISAVENNGIVFIDELDKICAREDQRRGGDVSREGVQRDLLPLIEGTTVSTKYGMVKTNHILFIASGAFHLAKPSDLLPELQGRLPTRVELRALSRDDFVRILTEPEANLVTQYKALMETENFNLEFAQDAIEAVADLAEEVNKEVENIGARRLHTIMEKLLDEVSFSASDRAGETETITAKHVNDMAEELGKTADLSKFIL
jgi:ATP-dependent HslUV protease ATP-binding subunit HslU